MQILIITSNRSPGTVVLPQSGPLTDGLVTEIAETWLDAMGKPTLLQEILRENLGTMERLRRFVVNQTTDQGTVISFTRFVRPETVKYRGAAIDYLPRHRAPFAVTLRSAILAAKTTKALLSYHPLSKSEYQDQ